jgi:two-component system cell cycle sensor histidine kinase/response regulator CckA
MDPKPTESSPAEGYQDIWEDSPLAIVRLDASGAIAAINPAGRRFLGVTGDVTGQPLVDRADPMDRAALSDMVARALNRARPARQEIRFVLADDRVFVGGVSLAFLEHATTPGAVAIIRDLTHEHALRPRLLETEKMASLGVVAATVAHEVNNPLMSARACLRLLRDMLEKPEHTELIDLAFGEIDRAAQIVQDLRQLASRSGLEREAIALEPFLEHVLRLHRLAHAHSEARVTLHCEPDLPAVSVVRNQMMQALLNLLRNADQAVAEMPVERRDIEVRAWAFGKDAVRIDIVDHGPGIPYDVRPHLFEPFFSSRRSGQGMGLGLAVVQAVAAAHGGRVDVLDTPGGGATFAVVLPGVMPEPRIEAHPVTEATPKTATAPTGTTDLAGRSLLIVEDESVLRMSLARYCTRQGLVVLEAADADSARTVIAEKHPDFVLLDLHFPGGGGVAVLQTIGEHHEALLPRTILMSGDLDGGASKWIGGGYARVLTKPFEPRVLIDILRTIPL